MNKIKQTLLLATTAFFLVSFTLAITSTNYTVLAGKSTVNWTGYKPGGQHEGIVDIKSGSLVVEGETITSGEFVIDMKSLKVTDTESQKLHDHLRGVDFFNVNKYTESKLVIKSSKENGKDNLGNIKLEVTGDLTILDKTNPITFEVVNTGKTENYRIYSANIRIDRTKWGITYKSSFSGDALINDEFDLKVKIAAKKN